jgi:DNA-binding MarR family transcriptional regulator
MADNDGVSDAEIVTLTVALFRHATTLAAGLAEVTGLAPTDATALRALDLVGGEERPVGALGRDLGLSSAATTGVVDRLERAGLAQRRVDPADRRRVLVSLTPQARAFGAEHLRPILERTRHAAGALDDEQRAAVRDFLAAVLDAPVEIGGDPDGRLSTTRG